MVWARSDSFVFFNVTGSKTFDSPSHLSPRRHRQINRSTNPKRVSSEVSKLFHATTPTVHGRKHFFSDRFRFLLPTACCLLLTLPFFLDLV